LQYKYITLNQRLQNDLELLLNGAFLPLFSFMAEKEYNSVLEKIKVSHYLEFRQRLPNSLLYSAPHIPHIVRGRKN
jgi:ATP sulfurylase